MTSNGIVQILLFVAALVAITIPVGAFMAKVFAGERTFLHPLLRPLERAIYKICGVDETSEQHWTRYAGAV
ncbi:MAG TPA: potassium-transporting ATPase subunit KdpA, partial [Bryobacteraceae bacterium]|nr:potassium-transporting ATPase subunit KdpA [Bryobacteraceae bacterium]